MAPQRDCSHPFSTFFLGVTSSRFFCGLILFLLHDATIRRVGRRIIRDENKRRYGRSPIRSGFIIISAPPLLGEVARGDDRGERKKEWTLIAPASLHPTLSYSCRILLVFVAVRQRDTIDSNIDSFDESFLSKRIVIVV